MTILSSGSRDDERRREDQEFSAFIFKSFKPKVPVWDGKLATFSPESWTPATAASLSLLRVSDSPGEGG